MMLISWILKNKQTQIYKEFYEKMIVELQDLKKDPQSVGTGMIAQIVKYSQLLLKINEAA